MDGEISGPDPFVLHALASATFFLRYMAGEGSGTGAVLCNLYGTEIVGLARR